MAGSYRMASCWPAQHMIQENVQLRKLPAAQLPQICNHDMCMSAAGKASAHQVKGCVTSCAAIAQVAMYEHLLADASIQRAEGGADEEEAVGPGKPALTAAQKRLKYLKIGAAAVGGGALLAVTGVLCCKIAD